jgi:phospholipid/cholesterol/gamma-HCH transport system substrate-binding protein
METRANYVVVGTFVVAVIIGMFTSILWLAHAQFNKKYAYYDIFFSGSVTGLSVGAPVNLLGVSIGRVTEIRLDPVNPEQVRVNIEVEAESPIKADSVASLELTGITGVYYVEVSGGSRDAPPITREEGQRYPVIAAKPSRFQSLVASLPEVLTKAIEVGDRLSAILDEKNRLAIANTLANVEQITAVGTRVALKLEGFIDDTDQAVGDFRHTMGVANNSLAEFQKTVAAFGSIPGDLNGTIKLVNGTLNHVDGLVQEVRPGVKDFSQSGLNDLHALISDARVLIAGLTRVAAEIERDPTRFLFGEKREGYKPR